MPLYIHTQHLAKNIQFFGVKFFKSILFIASLAIATILILPLAWLTERTQGNNRETNETERKSS